MSACVVLITAPRGPEAKKLTRLILGRRLAACVNIVTGIHSYFWWQGEIDSARESLLIVKTKRSLVKDLIATVRRAHSYEVCEVIALPVVAGNKPYIRWIDASCRKTGR